MTSSKNIDASKTGKSDNDFSKLGLNPEDLLEWYSTMVLLRALDERAWMMNRQGKAALVASCQGHEAAQLGAVWACARNAPSSAVFPYYRSLGTAVAAGITPKQAMMSYMAKAGEPASDARQFPLHGAVLESKVKVINISNVVATQIPHAVGYAMGARMNGNPIVTMPTFGDGATSQGDFHESMNFAAVQRLPVIFFCENNGFAISVPQNKQMAITDIADRAHGYGMPGFSIDGTDILEVYRVTTEAVRRALAGDGPTLIEAKVERYLPHTSDDDDRRYRSAEDIEKSKKRDPLKLFRAFMMKQGILTDELEERFQSESKKEVNKATDEAEAAPYPDTEDFYEHVYAE